MKTLSVGSGIAFSGNDVGTPGSDISDIATDGIAWEDSIPGNNTNNPKDMRPGQAGAAATAVQTDFLADTRFSQGAKITLTASTADNGWLAEYNFPTPVRINKSFTIAVYNETALTGQDAAQRHEVKLANTTNLATSGQVDLSSHWYEQGWIHLTAGTAELTVDKSDSDIQSTQIRVYNDSNRARDVYIGGLYFNARSRPKLIIIFDDGRNGIYDIAQAIMTTAGLRASVGVYESVVGSDTNNYCTLAELQELETTYGWEMCVHGGVHHVSGHSNVLADIQADVESEQAYLIANFNSPSTNIYMYPGGGVGTNSKQALINAGITHSRTTVAGLTSTALGLPQPYYIRSTTISDNNKANLLGDIDKAINAGATTTHYGHQVVPTTVADADLDITAADFQTYITGIKTRVDAGLLDVVLWREWVEGL